jgi:hypothetical protein
MSNILKTTTTKMMNTSYTMDGSKTTTTEATENNHTTTEINSLSGTAFLLAHCGGTFKKKSRGTSKTTKQRSGLKYLHSYAPEHPILISGDRPMELTDEIEAKWELIHDCVAFYIKAPEIKGHKYVL